VLLEALPVDAMRVHPQPVDLPRPCSPTEPDFYSFDSEHLFQESGLSTRERNRLKRKRKHGNTVTAFVQAPPPTSDSKFQATAAGPTSK
jgi:hypothetical protein